MSKKGFLCALLTLGLVPRLRDAKNGFKVLFNDSLKCRSRMYKMAVWCSAGRAGRGSELLSRSESATPENILHKGVQIVQVV